MEEVQPEERVHGSLGTGMSIPNGLTEEDRDALEANLSMAMGTIKGLEIDLAQANEGHAAEVAEMVKECDSEVAEHIADFKKFAAEDKARYADVVATGNTLIGAAKLDGYQSEAVSDHRRALAALKEAHAST